MNLARIVLSAVTLAALTGVVFAAEPSLEAARRCAAVTDATARVACYDHVFGTAATAPVVAPVATSAPAGTGAAVAGTAGVAAIGDDNLKKSSIEKAAPAAPTTAEAKITAVREMNPNIYRISLDNGQVWQTQEGRTEFRVNVGDDLRIERRPMGGYIVARVADGKPGFAVRAVRQK
jgi:hypothetical protein